MNPLKNGPVLLSVLILLMCGCSQVPAPAPQSALPLKPTAEPSPTHLPQTPVPTTAVSTSIPTASPSPRPSPLPSATPSSTPLPEITLSVPDAWQERAQRALAQLNETAGTQPWRLAQGAGADVRLANDPSGVMVAETAVVLAVPFTMAWETVSYDRALEILEQGHESVAVVPWPELQPGHKALRIDGLGPAASDYPLRETWSLISNGAAVDDVSDLASLLRQAGQDKVIHLAVVGDIMLDRSLGYNLARGDLAYPFSSVIDRLQMADVTVGNVESALGDSGEPQPKRYPFRAPPEAAQSLALAGFDVVSLANNHGMDYGEEALLQAVDLLRQQGVMPVGAGADSAAARAPHIANLNGLETAFFSYVNVPVEASTGFDTASWTATADQPGIAWGDPQVIASDVQAVRDHVDLVVVLLHSGFEYQELPSEPQIEAARTAVDAGADIVIGHHAHILQGIEHYEDGVIIYGTGNFAFDITGPPETAIFHIWLDENGVREIAVDPAIIQFGGQPRLAAQWEAPAILNRLYYLSDLLRAQ